MAWTIEGNSAGLGFSLGPGAEMIMGKGVAEVPDGESPQFSQVLKSKYANACSWTILPGDAIKATLEKDEEHYSLNLKISWPGNAYHRARELFERVLMNEQVRYKIFVPPVLFHTGTATPEAPITFGEFSRGNTYELVASSSLLL